MKKLFALLLVAGCATTGPLNVRSEDGGTLCQGSRAWAESNVCQPGSASGQCIKAIDGPFVLTSIKACERCKHPIRASIADTYIDQGTKARPRWEVNGDVHKVEIVINAGESLYFGTEGYNSVVDSSDCYVTWTGHRQ